MKSPVVFRASFEQPIGPLNPSRIVMSGPIWLEVYHLRINPSQWAARGVVTRRIFEKITSQPNPAFLQAQIKGLFFERQLSGWEAFDINHVPARKLEPADWSTDSNGVVHLTESYLDKVREERAKKVQPAKILVIR
jgi:hypothetical protein